ncbi:hypothetical protein [Streptomyces sp. NBC_01233]|uniref:hypothetical protein n=1 Tax=Streptomyces sp. NBC_01233 TaxID=2903787 RepID=UPI002E15CFAB|nr:hypothetical protein OG332_45665 [Streptomyces sp. NBC_01233]
MRPVWQATLGALVVVIALFGTYWVLPLLPESALLASTWSVILLPAVAFIALIRAALRIRSLNRRTSNDISET